MDALIQIQYNYLWALDEKDCTYVRLFAMGFLKAFDSVKHSLVGEKLNVLPLNPYVVNYYLNFLMDREEPPRVVLVDPTFLICLLMI